MSVRAPGTLAICEGHGEDGNFSARLSFPGNRRALSNAVGLKTQTFTVLLVESAP